MFISCELQVLWMIVFILVFLRGFSGKPLRWGMRHPRTLPIWQQRFVLFVMGAGGSAFSILGLGLMCWHWKLPFAGNSSDTLQITWQAYIGLVFVLVAGSNLVPSIRSSMSRKQFYATAAILCGGIVLAGGQYYAFCMPCIRITL
jgi:hypothetical protein